MGLINRFSLAAIACFSPFFNNRKTYIKQRYNLFNLFLYIYRSPEKYRCNKEKGTENHYWVKRVKIGL